jgi:hypothetical protein
MNGEMVEQKMQANAQALIMVSIAGEDSFVSKSGCENEKLCMDASEPI